MNQHLDEFKLQADKEREKTTAILMYSDPDYQNALKNFEIMEIKFNALTISPDTRETILAYMQAWDSIQMEQITYAYLGGLYRATLEVQESKKLYVLKKLITKQRKKTHLT